MKELLPSDEIDVCPKCGDTALQNAVTEFDMAARRQFISGYQVACMNCSEVGPIGDEDTSIEMWNALLRVSA